MSETLTSAITVNHGQLAQYLDFVIQNRTSRLVPVVAGPPGCGKSHAVDQAAERNNCELMIMHPVMATPEDFKGYPTLVDGEGYFVPFADLKRLVTATKPLVCFIDDAGQAPPTVQAALMQLVEARQIDGKKISDQVIFVLATNRREDKAAVTGMLEPLKGRSIMLNLEVTKDDWVAWAIEHDMPAELVAFIEMRPDMLTSFEASKSMTNSPTARTIARVGTHQRCGLPKELEYPVFSGCVGEGFATEYIGFLKIFRDLPNIPNLIANPHTSYVPSLDKPAVMYAICGALAYEAKPDNFANIMEYANRLPVEFSTMLVLNAIKRTPKLTSNPAFSQWGIKNADYLI